MSARNESTVRNDTSSIPNREDESEDDRRVQSQLDRAQRISERLARYELRQRELDGVSVVHYPVRELKFTIPGIQDEIAINPVVTLIGVACLWGIVIWCSLDRTNALRTLTEWRSYLSLTFTWFFQGSKAVFFFFVLYIWYKYGHIHLGKEEDKPEFSTLTYASMIFTAGAGNGLLVYSVFEPLLNRMHHFYAQAGYRSDDEKDQFAIGITVASWGLAGWAPYSIVAIAMSLAVYRYNLPMCYRSAFFPILGHYTWGWIGDAIDGLTIVFTLAGIFTSLGLLPRHIVAGLVYIGWVSDRISENHLIAIENAIIWLITVVSLTAVASGLRGGIKFLCILAMIMSCLLMFFVFMLDDTKFLLNLQVQTVGYYLQTSLFKLNFWTDAFGQLREGSGRAVDGKASEPWWMESSLNYIVGWWIAAASLNGQFICSISRGRKIWEVIVYSLVVPVGFCLIWFCIWGGIGLRQSRQAMELKLLGETYFNSSEHFLSTGSTHCYNVPQDTLQIGDQSVFTNHLPGVSPVCEYDDSDSDSAVFKVMNSFSSGHGSGVGPILSSFYMFTGVVFYLTGAGSAALFVDILASNGSRKGHLVRRVFWVVTVGALASVLFTSGGSDALSIVRAAMILCGLPCGILVCYLMQNVLLMCAAAKRDDQATDYRLPEQPEFAMPIYGGVFNVVEYVTSCGYVNDRRTALGMHQATRFHVLEFTKGVLVPFVSLHQVLAVTYPQNARTNVATTALFTSIFVGWFGLLLVCFQHPEASGFMWTLFMAKGCVLAMVRSGFRSHHNIRSNSVGDLVSSLFFWPQVVAQMRVQCVALLEAAS